MKLAMQLNPELKKEDLYPEGITSDEQLLAALKEKTKETYLADARETFGRLTKEYQEHGVVGATLVREDILENLKKAGLDASALDPGHKKSADEMLAELDKATVSSLKKAGQELIADMQNGNLESSRIQTMNEKIHEHGSFSGSLGGDAQAQVLDIIEAAKKIDPNFSLKDLDPEGKKTDQQMQDTLNSAVTSLNKQQYIEDAKIEYRYLMESENQGAEHALSSRERLLFNLKQAGVDASVLDPEHKKNAEQMLAEIDNVALSSLKKVGQEVFADLQDGQLDSSRTLALARQLENGNSPTDDLGRDIKNLVAKIVADAQKIDPNFSLKDLDPEGKKSDAQMQEALNANVDKINANSTFEAPSFSDDPKRHLNASLNSIRESALNAIASFKRSLSEFVQPSSHHVDESESKSPSNPVAKPEATQERTI